MVHEAELRHILIFEGDERPVLVGAGDGRYRPGLLPK